MVNALDREQLTPRISPVPYMSAYLHILELDSVAARHQN